MLFSSYVFGDSCCLPGPRGRRGPQGEEGPQGLQGEEGPQGE